MLLELTLLAAALGDLAGLLGGHEPADLTTHAAYLAISVLVVPLATAFALAGGTRWDTAVLAAACLASAVIALRVRVTWEVGHV